MGMSAGLFRIRCTRRVRLHDLKHSYASIALSQGESVLALGRLLGHASPETTLKYTHPANAMAHEAAEPLGATIAYLRHREREYTVGDGGLPGRHVGPRACSRALCNETASSSTRAFRSSRPRVRFHRSDVSTQCSPNEAFDFSRG